MHVVRIILTALLIFFGFAYLMVSFNAAGKDRLPTTIICAMLGVLTFTITYVMWR